MPRRDLLIPRERTFSLARAWRRAAVSSAIVLFGTHCGSSDSAASSKSNQDGATDAASEAAESASGSAGKDANGNPDVEGVTGGYGGSSGQGSGGATTMDASDDSADASVDDAPDGAAPPVSVFCGDAIRGVSDEECDDGNQALDDACSPSCRVLDFLALPGVLADSILPPPGRYIGAGRHGVAGADSGFAIAITTSESTPPPLVLSAFDPRGVRLGSPVQFAPTGTSKSLMTSNPVVAQLPKGVYAVAWTDFGGDGDGQGVAIRTADPSSATLGTLAHANVTTTFGQYDPDIVWTGNQIIVAWADASSVATGPDIKWRNFDAKLNPLSAEQSLAATARVESNVALTIVGSGWAASWREAELDGSELTLASSGSNNWSTGPHEPGPADEKPALVALDSSAMLLAFTAGTGSAARLRAALLKSSNVGSTTSFEVGFPSADAGAGSLVKNQPAAVRAGNRSYLAWRSAGQLGDPLGEEIWIAELGWDGVTLTIHEPIPLPRSDSHRKDDQTSVALAATSLLPQGAIAAAWQDYGRVFGGAEAAPDVVAELVPVPVLRLSGDGGLGQ